jgi:hypothetical protein
LKELSELSELLEYKLRHSIIKCHIENRLLPTAMKSGLNNHDSETK